MAVHTFYSINPTTDKLHKLYLCDTTAEIPNSGLQVGEMVITKDDFKFRIADSPTTVASPALQVATDDMDNDSVTLAKIQNIDSQTFLGRITPEVGDPELLTRTQATAMLDTFTNTLKGLVPASGGGTVNFLRADGSWQPPPGGGVTWPLLASNGSVIAPSYSFADDTGLGLFRYDNQTLGFAIAGGSRLILDINALTLNVNARALSGWAGSPSYTFQGDTDTGMYSASTNQLGFSTNGVARLLIRNEEIMPQVRTLAPWGTSGTPSYAFSGTGSQTGMYLIGQHELGFTIGSNLYLSLNATALWPRNVIRGALGSVASPAYSFRDDTDTGMYRAGENHLGFSCGGYARMGLSNDQLRMYVPIRTEDGSAGSPAFAFANSTNMGMYRDGTGLCFANGGAGRMRIGSNGALYIRTNNYWATVSIDGRLTQDAGLAVFDTTMGNGTSNHIKIGRDMGARNHADIAFRYESSGSNSNYWGVGFWGMLPILRVYPTRRVGIQRRPVDFALEVEGNAGKTSGGSSWVMISDERIKRDIQNVKNAINTIMKLRPVSFRYKKEYIELHPSVEDKVYYDYIAQEYKKVFPDDVMKSDEEFEGHRLYKMDPSSSPVVLVKAVQELVEEVRRIEKRLSACERKEVLSEIFSIFRRKEE